MAIWPFRRKALDATPAVLEMAAARELQPIRSLGGTNINTQRINSVFVQAQSASYGYLYKHQPAVRSVVDYVARNIAQLGLKVYERVSDDERVHRNDHPAAQALRNPNPFTPGQRFVFTFVADFLTYDNAYILKFRAQGAGRVVLVNVPPSAIGIIGQQRFQVDGYRVWRADGTFFDVLPDDVIHWAGYDPDDPRVGFSKLETLRQELAADATARQAKTELDRAGLVPKGWIERPAEAPEWSQEGMDRFREAWANWAKSSARTTPVLEDGMAFKQSEVSPEQAQLLESRKFTKAEVASVFGLCNVPPETEEERQQVYTDVLPPYCEMLCAFLDLGLLVAEFGEDRLYTEFNLDEKHMGDDRLKALTSATGRPVLTTNEGRSRLNLPPIDGGDELVTPANVIVGDNPKPSTDLMPIQDPNKPDQDGSFRQDQTPTPAGKALEVQSFEPRLQSDFNRQQRYVDEVAGTLARFYTRQEKSLKRKGGYAQKGFDQDRWDTELAADIERQVRSIVEREGGIYAARLTADDFDMRRVENYLKAMAGDVATAINRVTKQDIEDMGLDDALERAKGQRLDVGSAAIGSRATIFARTEAAKQAPHPERRMKTWIADTERHASLNGATVPLDKSFGGIEPGSEPNCKCSLSIA